MNKPGQFPQTSIKARLSKCLNSPKSNAESTILIGKKSKEDPAQRQVCMAGSHAHMFAMCLITQKL